MRTVRFIAAWLFLFCSMPVMAQVSGSCGPGKTCTVAKLKATKSVTSPSMCEPGNVGWSMEPATSAWQLVGYVNTDCSPGGGVYFGGNPALKISVNDGILNASPAGGFKAGSQGFQYSDGTQASNLQTSSSYGPGTAINNTAYLSSVLVTRTTGLNSISCNWAGATGGTSGLGMQIVSFNNAGVIGTSYCTCKGIGTCANASGAGGSCNCNATIPAGTRVGIFYTKTDLADGGTVADCATNPTSISCSTF